MSNSVKGKIVKICPIEKGTSKAGKEWSKQNLVIDTGDQYNPNVCINFFGDKSDLLQNVSVGNDVEVHINISSREFNGKWYHNVDGWKIDGGASQGSTPPPSNEGDDDLPF